MACPCVSSVGAVGAETCRKRKNIWHICTTNCVDRNKNKTHEEYILLTVQFGDSPMFWRNKSLPSSWLKSRPCKKPAEEGRELGLLFNRDDRGDLLSRNIGLSPNYMSFQPRQPLFIVTAMRTSNSTY
jgi:hypothetical protein